MHNMVVSMKRNGTRVARKNKGYSTKAPELSGQKEVTSKAKYPVIQAEHDHVHRASLLKSTLKDYVELHNTTAEVDYTEVNVQVFQSEYEAVRSCELVEEHCQAISKLNNIIATYSFPITSEILISVHGNSTLYVKAAFISKLEFSMSGLSCGLEHSNIQPFNSTEEQSCRLPAIDPFDKNAMSYFIKMSPMTCELEATLFTRYQDGLLEVVNSHDRGNYNDRRLIERSYCKREQGMTDMHKEIINCQKEAIVKDLEVTKILKKLMTKRIFDEKDKKAIEKKTNDRLRSSKLLDILLDKVPDRFSDFVDILCDGTQKFLAIGLLKEESKEYQKEKDALWSFLNEMAEARKEIYERKYELELELKGAHEKIGKCTTSLL
ncbi:uncharacterized protein LOC111342815 [Stylophora pistillata]|uniref:uncharacterized protein LOC111342815 n=1 Tax=Stylophora pistillata TaxID=50429 RepID=UPI000C052043|nr:uncharacterized protein LOC111342815 [Stylophora pistillata]